MNRLIIIGNGFDLAHGLKTSYKDFIEWYWNQKVDSFPFTHTDSISDELCKLHIIDKSEYSDWSVFAWSHSNFKDPITKERRFSGRELMKQLQEQTGVFKIKFTEFFKRINNCIESRGWVDIENEYYDLLKRYSKDSISYNNHADELNEQLAYLQAKLIEYLGSISIDKNVINKNILKKIYSPINPTDVSIKSHQQLENYVENLIDYDSYDSLCAKLCSYNKNNAINKSDMDKLKKSYDYEGIENVLYSIQKGFCNDILLPDNIMLLSFNYTNTAELYLKIDDHFSINYIHGKLEDKNSIIFGYGDELDEEYKQLQNQNINEYLKNIKSIRYLESENYRNVLSFIESAPYQVCIMGHSCGNSDRTLLNTLFEHKNCISVKPYYYKKDDGTDNYLEIAQNISRNFTDMKLMRDRVVNKKYCETLAD